jgi:hypothetical protein
MRQTWTWAIYNIIKELGCTYSNGDNGRSITTVCTRPLVYLVRDMNVAALKFCEVASDLLFPTYLHQVAPALFRNNMLEPSDRPF